MQKNYMTYRRAAGISLWITVAFMAFFLIALYLRGNAVSEDIRHGPEWQDLNILRLVYDSVMSFLTLFAMYALNFKILSGDMTGRKKTFVAIAATLVLAAVFSLVQLQVSFWIFGMPDHFPKGSLFGGLVRDVFLAVMVIFTSQIIYLSQRRQQMALQYETLEAENMRTRYESLKNQVDPHFLFNTLSTLDSLVAVDPVKGREYIQKLAAVFRYTLQNKDVAPLSEELTVTRDYAALMQIRYGDALKIRFDIDERYKDYSMAPLGIQTLVENAIKHNVISNREPLTITVETTDEGMLLVSNNYQPKAVPEPGTGVGLANLAERYRLKWQKDISIKQLGNAFCVYLPLIKPRQI